MEKDSKTYQIPTKKVPQQKIFNIDSKRIRDIDINPPVQYGKSDEGMKRLDPNTLIIDSTKHNNYMITNCIYAAKIKRVITLDSLSTVLKLYKLNCKLDRVIKG